MSWLTSFAVQKQVPTGGFSTATLNSLWNGARCALLGSTWQTVRQASVRLLAMQRHCSMHVAECLHVFMLCRVCKIEHRAECLAAKTLKYMWTAWHSIWNFYCCRRECTSLTPLKWCTAEQVYFQIWSVSFTCHCLNLRQNAPNFSFKSTQAQQSLSSPCLLDCIPPAVHWFIMKVKKGFSLELWLYKAMHLYWKQKSEATIFLLTVAKPNPPAQWRPQISDGLFQLFAASMTEAEAQQVWNFWDHEHFCPRLSKRQVCNCCHRLWMRLWATNDYFNLRGKPTTRHELLAA